MTESLITAGSLAMTPAEARQQLREVESVVADIMKEGEHYGVIPGTGTKKTLFQPGAQLLANVYQYADQDVEFVDKVEQWATPISESSFPLFAYTIRIPFFDRSGRKVCVGIGSCNSYETRYRWRDSSRKCPACGKEAIIKGKEEYGGGWICFTKKGGCGAKYKTDDPAVVEQKTGRSPNDAIFDQVNTILKIAKKRAYVNGVISATRTSGMFTQDMEDFAHIEEAKAEVLSSTPTISAGTPAGAKAIAEAQRRDAVPEGGDVPLASTIVPVGMNKGRKLSELTDKQLDALIAAYKKRSLEPEFVAKAEAYVKDAFGGVFDREVDRDRRAAEADEGSGRALTPDQKAILVDELQQEILTSLRMAIPNAGKKAATKADRELMQKICTETFGVKSWQDFKTMEPSAIREKMLGLVEAVGRVVREKKEGQKS